MENEVKVNAPEIVNLLLASLVQEVANAVAVQVREMVADATNERLGELECKFRELEDHACTEENFNDFLDSSPVLERAVENAVENAIDAYDFSDQVMDIVRNMNFTIDVD